MLNIRRPIWQLGSSVNLSEMKMPERSYFTPYKLHTIPDLNQHNISVITEQLYNFEIIDLAGYSSPNNGMIKPRLMNLVQKALDVGVLVGNHDENRLLGRPRYRLGNSIITDLKGGIGNLN